MKILCLIAAVFLAANGWATDIVPNPGSPGNLGHPYDPFPNIYGTNIFIQTIIFSDGTTLTTSGLGPSNNIITLAGAAISGSNYATQAGILLSNYVSNGYLSAWTNNNGNINLGTIGGNPGSLWLSDSVNSRWDSLLGNGGTPLWNNLTLLTNQQTGVNLSGTFSGNGFGLTNQMWFQTNFAKPVVPAGMAGFWCSNGWAYYLTTQHPNGVLISAP